MAAFEHAQGSSRDPARHAFLRGRQGDPVVPTAADENRAADPDEALPGVVFPTGSEHPAYSGLMAGFVGKRIIPPRSEEFVHSGGIIGLPSRVAPYVGN